MNSGASRQRKSFADTQPFCWIMSEAHSVFQIRVAFSVSDGSILMWMRRMIDIGVLLASSWLGRDNRRERKHRCSRTAAVRRKSPQAAAAEEALAAARSRDNRRHVSVRYNLWSNYNAPQNPFSHDLTRIRADRIPNVRSMKTFILTLELE